MEDLHPISHKFVWVQESKHHTLLDDLQNIQSTMHTLVVVEDVDVAEQATQFLDRHGISVHNYDFDHKDQAIAQSFRSGEIPILITTVEEDFYEKFTGTATNVLVVDVPLFSTSQYLIYKELLSKLGGHLTFYVDNDNWLSVAYVIKQLLEQGISLTTDPYPPSPKSPSSPVSHPSLAGELARLQQELQSVQNTLADKHDHFALVSKAYEQAIQHLLASNNRLCHSITQLQAVMRPSCSSTQSPSDVSLAQTKDVNGSYVNPDSFPYPSVDGIQECLDTPVPNGIQQRLALPRPKPRPQLSMKKDVPSWLDVPRPQSKPRLSLKRASKVPSNPDVCHQDSPVPAIASEDVYHASTCTPTLSDSDLGVSNEVKTCIPSPVASPDLNDVTAYSSEVSKALSHVESALSHAYAVLEHSLTCDIKLHPPDKSHFNSPPLSVTSASPKSPFDKVAPVQCGSSTHNLCPTLYTGKKEKHLNCSGDKALGDENTHQPMVSPPVLQGSTDHTPNHAQSLVSSGHAYRPSLLSSKGLSLPVSHDENAHHVEPCNPCLVAPSASKDKLNPSTKKLYGCDPVPPDLTASHLCQDKPPLTKAAGPIGKKTCRACAAPNRYFIPCHELLPKFLSQTDMSADVLRESDLLQETVSDVSEYMFHEANNPIDSGYHSPEPMVPANRDASSNSVSMVPVSAMKVPCPFPKGGTLVDLPCNKNEVLSPVLCKDMGCLDVKFPGQVLSLASTPRVSGENLTNAGSIWASLGKLETFEKPNYSTPCNCIVGPIEEKVLPSPMEFPAQSMVASHPSGVDGYSEDSVSEAPIYVQSTSTHNRAITSPDEPLN